MTEVVVVFQTPEREFLLRASYLEIYNEKISDLLSPEEKNLKIQLDQVNFWLELYDLALCESPKLRKCKGDRSENTEVELAFSAEQIISYFVTH